MRRFGALLNRLQCVNTHQLAVNIALGKVFINIINLTMVTSSGCMMSPP